jgi:hypothetical protein
MPSKNKTKKKQWYKKLTFLEVFKPKLTFLEVFKPKWTFLGIKILNVLKLKMNFNLK